MVSADSDDVLIISVKSLTGGYCFGPAMLNLLLQAVCPFGTPAMEIPDRGVGNVSGYL